MSSRSNTDYKRSISVVIPTFNYARYLPRAIDSVLAQKQAECEIVVVDDGSTDETEFVVREYVSRLPERIRYFQQENRGPGAARNHGVRVSTGAVILFMDGDDALLPESLEQFGNGLARNSSADFLWGSALKQFPDGTFEVHPAEPLDPQRDSNFKRHLRNLWIMKVGSVAVRRRVFDRIRFPESNRGFEHCVFNAHLLALYDGVTVEKPVVRVYTHADSLCHNVEWTKLRRLETADLVFDPTILPEPLMPLRYEYVCGLWSSLFQDFNWDLQRPDRREMERHLSAIPLLIQLASAAGTRLPQADREVSHACLSLFRTLYVMGHGLEAAQLYRLAFRTFPSQALQWRYLRKYVRLVLYEVRGWSRRVSTPVR
jgi:glycosyltransferase involved in cell wall biosynthesis